MTTPCVKVLLSELLACETGPELAKVLSDLTVAELKFVLSDWETWAHFQQIAPDRLKPETQWSTWLIMGGRGAGKTRAGAEWVRQLVRTEPSDPALRIALVGASYGEAREVMIDGVSGLRSLNWVDGKPTFTSSRRQITWPNGAVAQLFSAEDPEELRGPQFGFAWLDEVGKWSNDRETFDMLQFGLRLGKRPRQVITTTPRPTRLLKQLLSDDSVVTTRMTTDDNAVNLPRAFLEAVNRKYGETRLGRQELEGELVDDIDAALFTRELIERARCRVVPPLRRIVIGVDPPVSHKARASVCGIVCAGVSDTAEAYVLEDASLANATPYAWAKRVVETYERWNADRVVAEVNQGGDMVETVLRNAFPALSFAGVHATRGKRTRAEPVAALYERGLVHHAGQFRNLEDQMCNFGPDGLSLGESPDRVDALVWSLTHLMLNAADANPRIRKT